MAEGRQCAPTPRHVDCRLCIHQPEAIIVVETVSLRCRAELQRAPLPAIAVGVHLSGGGREDQFDVPPRQRTVGLAHERGNAGDHRRRGARAAKVSPVAVSEIGREDARQAVVQAVAGRATDPQTRAPIRVIGALTEVVDGAHRRDSVEAGIFIEGRVVIVASVSSCPNVEDPLASVAIGDATFYSQLPEGRGRLRKTDLGWPPTVAADSRGGHMPGHGIRFVNER